MNRWIRIALGTAMLVLLAGCGAASEPESPPESAKSVFRGAEMRPPVTAANFRLHDQDGRVVTLAQQRGRLAIVAFLYTRCPDVCPLIAQNLNAALRDLTATERRQVRVLAISVDPVGDTPAAVRRFAYVHRLVPEFRYLTGTRARLEPVWTAYQLGVAASSPATIDHAAYEMLVDQHGDGRVVFDAQVDSRDVVHDVRALLGSG